MTVDSAAATTTTSGRVYPVAVDKSGYLSVSVPWTAVTETTVRNWGFTKNEGTLTDVDLFVGGPDAKEDGATTNGNTYLNLLMNSGIRSVHNIVGSGHTTVTSDASGTITINSTVPDISNLVPYTGATKNVDLGKHSLFISNKDGNTNNPVIKVLSKGIEEDDVRTIIEPAYIRLEDPGLSWATLTPSYLDVTDGANSCTVRKDGFIASLDPSGTDVTNSAIYKYDGIDVNNKKLLFPSKAGTIALTSDLDEKQNSSAFLSFISDTDISNNKLGFLRVYMKPIETPGITHYVRVAELQDLPLASSSEYGTVKLGSDAQQSVSATPVSSMAYRTYAIQKDPDGKLVVNVPWYLQNATYDTRGIGYLGRAIHIDGTGYATHGYYYDRNSDIQICFGTTQKSNGLISVTFARKFKGAPTVVLEPFFKSTTSTSIGTQYRNAQTVRCYLVNGSAATTYSLTSVVTGFQFDSGNNEDQYFNYIAIGQSTSDTKYDNPQYEGEDY